MIKKQIFPRRNLLIANIEGIPAAVFQTLLGGQFLTGYMLYLGASSSQLGFVLAITTLFNVGQFGVAYSIQKLNSRKRAMIFFLALHRLFWGATGLVPFLFARESWVSAFIILYTIAFMFNTFGAMLWTSLISDMVPARVRGRYFGFRNTMLNAVNALTLFGGGMLLDHIPGSRGFLILYIVVWAGIVLNVVMFTFYADIPFERSAERSFVLMVKRPLRDSSFMKATLFLAGFLFLQSLAVPLYSYVMLHLLKINYQSLSLLNVTQTVFMMASFAVWGNLNMRYSNKRLLFWTLPMIALSCLMWGGLSVLPVLPVLLLIHALLGVGSGGFSQLAFNFMIGDTPKSERPMYMAMYNAITGLASFLGPLIGGLLYELMSDWPRSVQIYGIQLVVGTAMLLFAATLGRRILRG